MEDTRNKTSRKSLELESCTIAFCLVADSWVKSSTSNDTTSPLTTKSPSRRRTLSWQMHEERNPLIVKYPLPLYKSTISWDIWHRCNFHMLLVEVCCSMKRLATVGTWFINSRPPIPGPCTVYGCDSWTTLKSQRSWMCPSTWVPSVVFGSQE